MVLKRNPANFSNREGYDLYQNKTLVRAAIEGVLKTVKRDTNG